MGVGVRYRIAGAVFRPVTGRLNENRRTRREHNEISGRVETGRGTERGREMKEG